MSRPKGATWPFYFCINYGSTWLIKLKKSMSRALRAWRGPFIYLLTFLMFFNVSVTLVILLIMSCHSGATSYYLLFFWCRTSVARHILKNIYINHTILLIYSLSFFLIFSPFILLAFTLFPCIKLFPHYSYI